MIDIPDNIRGSLERYVHGRIPPGDCVRAILSNNLIDAVVRADSVTAAALADIVQWCRWALPSDCWGSPEVVKRWLDGADDG
jgi:hypothetical protein